MGIIFCDGLDAYGSTADVTASLNWTLTSPWAWAATGGRRNGGCLTCAPNAAKPNAFTAPLLEISIASGTMKGTCFWFKISAAPSVGQQLMFHNAGNGVGVDAAGRATMWVNTAVSQTSNVLIADNQWHWYEFRCWDQNGNGLTAVWIDGINFWNAAILDGTGSYFNSIFYAMATNGTVTIDDVIVADANSPGLNANNMPFGYQLITMKQPQADVTKVFVPDTGSTNYARLIDIPSDDDSSYVQSGNSGDADQYDYAALGFTPTTINGVQIVTRAKNAGAGQINLKTRCISAGTTSDKGRPQTSGSGVLLPPNYQPIRAVYDQDPKTSAAWTQTNLDAATFGPVVQ